jgi:uncharacterized protein (DUF2267 family)
MRHLAELQGTVGATEEWVDDLQQRLGWHDLDRAYAALLTTLHALRDVLPQDEAVYVGAQLPVLLRGLYYDGWHPSKRGSMRSRNAFIERIQDGVHRDPGIDAEQVARAVLAVLAARLPAGELEDARAATPRSLHNLWPS